MGAMTAFFAGTTGLLQNDLAHIYWDIDEKFIDDPIHDAGLFSRTHKKTWNYFKSQAFNKNLFFSKPTTIQQCIAMPCKCISRHLKM